jgi:TonB family protein
MRIFDENGLREALDGLQEVPRTYPRWLLGYRAHRFWLGATIVAAVACSVLHIATFFVEPNLVEFDLVTLAMLPLTALAALAFARMLMASGLGRESRRRALAGDILGSLRRMIEELSGIMRKTPVRARIGILLVGLYCTFNVYAFMRLGLQGSCAQRDGQAWLKDHGNFVRTLTESDFPQREIWDLRALSGHLACLSLVAAIGFRYWGVGRSARMVDPVGAQVRSTDGRPAILTVIAMIAVPAVVGCSHADAIRTRTPVAGASGSEAVAKRDEPSTEAALPRKRFVYAGYFNAVKDQVRPHWSPAELYHQRDPHGTVYGQVDRYTLLQVRMNHDGSLADVRVAHSCGLEWLDETAVEAFRKAQPFAPPPIRLLRPDGTIQFGFGFFFDVKRKQAEPAPNLRLYRYRDELPDP